MHKKAKAGELKNYTGIDSRYEVPVNLEIGISNGSNDIDSSVNQVLKNLKNRVLL